MAETITCRNCRRPISAEDGCIFCLPVKKHLAVEDDGDSASLATIANEAAKILRAQGRQLALKQLATTGYDPGLGNESRKHAGALSKLLEASRKLQQDGENAIDAMGFEERANLFVEWFGSLPATYRRSLLARLERNQSPPDSRVLS